MSVSKVIIINESASKKKYGTSGWSKIKKAIDKLVAADKKRNIGTQVVAIDSAKSMKPFQGKPVKKSSSAIQVKRAIDAIFKSTQPHYLVLLGGPDLIPHVKMRNPIQDAGEDPNVPSDLPYACDAAYSLNIENFVGPTRVLGRLPDVPNDSSPNYLIALLKVAAGWKSGSASQYANYFGVTAEVWKQSSRKNVKKLFGTTKKLKICPHHKSPWSKVELKPRMHFINCHGADTDAGFYGEPGPDPLAHWSEHLENRITEGTVVAAECCYGAMLYEPAPEFGIPMSIPNRYLRESAYGYLGSTNIAWGSSTFITLADEICQRFILSVQTGASLGRSLLEARQKFVAKNAPLGPHSLKTLAQFTLLGDPSIHPVKSTKTTKPVSITQSFINEVADHVADGVDMKQLFRKSILSAAKVAPKIIEQRSDRRLNLFRKGVQLSRQIAAVNTVPEIIESKKLLQMLKGNVGKKAFEAVQRVSTYVVEKAEDYPILKSVTAKRRAKGGLRFMVGFLDNVDGQEPDITPKGIKSKSTSASTVKLVKRKMVVAKERDGKIEDVQEYYSR